MHRLLTLTLVSAFAVSSAAAIGAEPPSTPVIANPSHCHVTGRTPQELERLRMFVAARGTPAPSDRGGDALPEGPPADAATRVAVAATVDEIFACFAAGNSNRAYLLLSDAYLVRDIGDPGEAVAFVAGLGPASLLPSGGLQDRDGDDSIDSASRPATPQASPNSSNTLIIYAGPWDVRMLPDGRVAAAVWLSPALGEDEHPAPGVTAIWLFVKEGGRWRMDGTITEIWPTPSKQPRPGRRAKAAPEPINVADLVGWPEVGEPSSATPTP